MTAIQSIQPFLFAFRNHPFLLAALGVTVGGVATWLTILALPKK